MRKSVEVYRTEKSSEDTPHDAGAPPVQISFPFKISPYYISRPYRDLPQESSQEWGISYRDEDISQDDQTDNIHHAIDTNNLDAVQRHLDDSAALEYVVSYRFKPSSTLHKNVTPLMLAAREGCHEIVELLLRRGANAFAVTTSTNMTALHFAAGEGYESIVQILFDHGGTKLLEIGTVEGRTPLLAAANRGHAPVVRLLLDKGADIAAMEWVSGYLSGGGKLEKSAFSLAAERGHVDVLDVLLSRVSKAKFEDDYGSQALHAAAEFGHLAVVKRLLEDHIGLLDSQGFRGQTAISLALKNGNLDVFLYLLDKGADISTKEDTGGSFLYQATKHANLQAIDQILKKDASLLDVQNRRGRTAIFAALANDQLDIFDFLFDKGADITIKDRSGNTSLHYAVQYGHLQAVDRILTKEASLLDVKDHDGRTAISLALENGHFETFDHLFDQGADITSRDQFGNTSFHYAAEAGCLQAVKKVLAKEPSLLDSKGRAGKTGLLFALQHCRMDVARCLIEKGADVIWESDNGETALELACEWGLREINQLSLNRIRFDDDNIPHASQRGYGRQAALITAAGGGCVPIVFQLLEAEIYFPQFPARTVPHFSGRYEAESVLDFIWGLFDAEMDDAKSDVINKHGEAILYWAILNGEEELVSECMSKIKSVQDQWERGGGSWAHVAALGGHTNILEQLLLNGICSLAPTEENITPFHLAVKHNHFELLVNLVTWYSRCPILYKSVDLGTKNDIDILRDIPHEDQYVDLGTENENIDVLRDILHEEGGILHAIIRKQQDGHTAISLAASGTSEFHRELEGFLWEAVESSIDKASFFCKPLQDDAKLVLELAAQFETPGEETHLESFLKSIPQPPFSELSGLDAFQLAVHHKLPVVVWWLLSNGWDLSGNHIEKGQQLTSKWEHDDSVGNIIKEILENPPPLQKNYNSTYEEHLPTFQYLPQNHGLVEGTVLDFYHEGQQASIQLKRRSMTTLIYDEGPDYIMKPSPYLDLSSLKGVLSSTEESSKEAQRKEETAAAFGTQGKSLQDKQRVIDLRWIHLPANNLRCVEELMIRISQDRKIKNKDHCPWADFVRKSWGELPAGGNKFYMKPQCVRYQRSKTHRNDHSSGDSHEMGTETRTNGQSGQIWYSGGSALYMPYLFWKKCSVEPPHNTDTGSVQLTKSATATQTKLSQASHTTQTTLGRQVVHDSMTLDQYYYSSLENTTIRDMDQVLWRSTDPKLKQTGNESGKNQDLLENRQPNDEKRKILIVNQLWLWILDKKTIITSTTNEMDETESSFLQRVLMSLRAQEKKSSISVENIQELILSTATSFFNKKDVEVLGNKKSPLGVYRAAILNVRDKEAHLFDVFQKSLDGTATEEEGQANANESTNKLSAENEGPSESQDAKNETGLIGRLFKSKGTWKGRDKYNPYGDIAGETELLREVKDICDELNMLKSLASDQESVWKQIWKNGYNPDATFTYNTPSEVKKEITEMVKEAEFVQKAIDMLLDLKQKQANIVEAEFSRKRSEETAKQSDTIMAFTVVTILFLPASFLTSLLALDISDFPHVGDNVRFQGRMIFPIIFGVSIFVSGFFAVIAYNASTLKEYAFGRRKSQKRKMTTSTTVEPKEQTLQQAKLQMEQLREQLILSKRMKKEDEYSWSVSGGDHMV